jgi:hypothetical protein
MSNRKRGLSTTQLFCRGHARGCTFVPADERALAIHANYCTYIQDSRDEMLSQAQQAQQFRRPTFGRVAEPESSSDEGESEQSQNSLENEEVVPSNIHYNQVRF